MSRYTFYFKDPVTVNETDHFRVASSVNSWKNSGVWIEDMGGHGDVFVPYSNIANIVKK